MNYLAVAVALTGLLTSAAAAQSAPCKALTAQEQAQAGCPKKAVPNAQAQTRSISPMTPADKEILDRAHTRTLLENLDSQIRRR